MYKSDEEFQENNGQVNVDEELQGSDEHVTTDEESQENDGHLDIHEQDHTAPLTLQSALKPQKDQIIQFYHDEDGDHLQVAKIVSGAGEVTGQYKHWYNIEHIKPDSPIANLEKYLHLILVRPGDCQLYSTQMLLNMVRDLV